MPNTQRNNDPPHLRHGGRTGSPTLTPTTMYATGHTTSGRTPKVMTKPIVVYLGVVSRYTVPAKNENTPAAAVAIAKQPRVNACPVSDAPSQNSVSAGQPNSLSGTPKTRLLNIHNKIAPQAKASPGPAAKPANTQRMTNHIAKVYVIYFAYSTTQIYLIRNYRAKLIIKRWVYHGGFKELYCKKIIKDTINSIMNLTRWCKLLKKNFLIKKQNLFIKWQNQISKIIHSRFWTYYLILIFLKQMNYIRKKLIYTKCRYFFS